MNPIFENAVDSLKAGIEYYLSGKEGRPIKFAILSIYNCVELFLKERLYRYHRLLIYKNIDKPIDDDSLTVGVAETLGRLSNLGLRLTKEETSDIVALQKQRNRIEHHSFERDAAHAEMVGQVLKFLYKFLPKHLDTTLEEHLNAEEFRQVRSLILSYDELLAEAKRQVESQTAKVSKDDYIRDAHEIECPECGHDTLVVNSDRGNFCFFCHCEELVEQCSHCGEYYPPYEFEDSNICESCFHDMINRD
jgi:DNA-directed RNA polymerase subunit RPC12/RpoP